MLIEYAFSNFRSFKGNTSLSMRANSQTTLNNHLIRLNNKRYLPCAIIYGANASGKSNVIMSLSLMKEIVLHGGIDVNITEINNLEIYPFAYHKQQDMTFAIEFASKDLRYKYSFSLDIVPFEKNSKRKINSECLNVASGKNYIQLFSRNENDVRLSQEKAALDLLKCDRKLIIELEDRINKNLDNTRLFLSNAFKSIVSTELADTVIGFFREKLMVVSDFTQKSTDVSITTEDILDKDFVLWSKVLDVFVKGADFGPQKIMMMPRKIDEAHTAKMQLVSMYETHDKAVMLPSNKMESRGTLKLLDFAIPFVDLFKKGGIFVLDEFDAAIHPELVKGIIALFHDSDINTERAQLIFTTHNPIYLNNKIFRRDQIRFVEKDPDTYQSVMYTLADFGSADVRNDENYLVNYFKGKYGALPYIDFAKLLIPPSKEENEEC